MGLGTFDAFLTKLGELNAPPPTSEDLLLDIAQMLAGSGNRLPWSVLVSSIHCSKADLLRAIFKGQAAGLFEIEEDGGYVKLTPGGASFVAA